MRKNSRVILLEWAEQSRIDRSKLTDALRLSDATPSSSDWLRFLDKFLLALGALLAVSGVIFFFAYNWDDLGRFTRFALVQGLIVITLGAVWYLGLEKISGKIALFAAGVLVGVLLALVGQTYQTGADTYELFAVWCVLILPWTFLSRFDLMWLFCLMLLNMAIVLYYETFGGFFSFALGVEQMLWLLFVINTVALVVWEWLAHSGRLKRRNVRWMTRLLATISGGLVTALAIFAVLGNHFMGVLPGLIAWLVWMLIAFYWYRKVELDVYVLAIGVLSVVAVVNTGLSRVMFDSLDIAGVIGFMLISLSVISISAVGAVWLKRVVAEAQS
jgi:uncharacterized membrane protein